MTKVSPAGLVRKASVAVVGASGTGREACITALKAAGYQATGCTPDDVARLKAARTAPCTPRRTADETGFAR